METWVRGLGWPRSVASTQQNRPPVQHSPFIQTVNRPTNQPTNRPAPTTGRTFKFPFGGRSSVRAHTRNLAPTSSCATRGASSSSSSPSSPRRCRRAFSSSTSSPWSPASPPPCPPSPPPLTNAHKSSVPASSPFPSWPSADPSSGRRRFWARLSHSWEEFAPATAATCASVAMACCRWCGCVGRMKCNWWHDIYPCSVEREVAITWAADVPSSVTGLTALIGNGLGDGLSNVLIVHSPRPHTGFG